MFEDLLDSRKLLVTFIDHIADLKKRVEDSNDETHHVELLNILRKNLIKLIFFVDNVLHTFDGKIENENSTSYLVKNLKENDKNIKLIGLIKDFNYKFLRSLIDFGNDLYDDDYMLDSERSFANLAKSYEYLTNFSAEFSEFYKIGNSQFDRLRMIEEKYLEFTEQKTKELEILFGNFEGRIKSAQSMYTITSKDLESLHNEVLEINENLKSNYNKMREVEKNINEFKSIYDAQILKFRNELDFRINEIENTVRSQSNEKLNIFLTEIDSSTILFKSEFDEIKNTTKKFSEFMSDETSTKLTNDFKSKAETEMVAYYGFTALSFIIIFVAILISWNTLHTFADAHIGDGKDYNNLDLIYLSIRLIFSLIVFLSVTYTSKLASKSYTYWKKNEGIFLRLTALKSFIADMSETKKEEIHEKLVDVYFGKDDQDNNLNNKLKDLPNNITQLLGKVVEQSSVVFDSTKKKKEDSSSSSDNKND